MAETASQSTYLFVYGTLRRGHPHSMAHVLKSGSESWACARLSGRLYDLGAYPCVVASERLDEVNSHWVYGDLFKLNEPSRPLLSKLDQYEGDEYVRRQRTVEVTPDVKMGEDPDKWPRSVLAWVYLFEEPPASQKLIQGGDYLEYLRNKRLQW